MTLRDLNIMNWIKENQSKAGIAVVVILLILFAAVYFGPESVSNKDSLAGALSPELEECLQKVQKRVDDVTVDLNEWLADPESEQYDNSTVWDDVAALAQKDRDKCYAEFEN
jgi:hypothetical protein